MIQLGMVRWQTVVGAAAAYLTVAWLSIILIDVIDVAGLRSTLGRDDGAPLWVHLFGEGSITEILQWTVLGLVALVVSQAAGALRAPSEWRERRFLSLLGLGVVLMLIEDAGNPSHRVARYVRDFLGEGSYLIELLSRLPVLLLVGGVPLYAFARYWWPAVRGRPGGGLLLSGLIAYGIAAFSSVPANILFNFYPRAGRWVTESLFGGRLQPLEQTAPWQLRFSAEEFTGTVFMDYVYEESIELIGVTFLLAGSLALSRFLAQSSAQPKEEEIDRNR